MEGGREGEGNRLFSCAPAWSRAWFGVVCLPFVVHMAGKSLGSGSG
jgi:hypothetical protein